MRAAWAIAVVLLGVPVALLACNGVLGFEERTLDPCVQYCDTIQTSCVQARQQYQDEESCLATCRLLPPGTEERKQGNTVLCRLDVASQVEGGDDPALLCPAAGPSGFDALGTQVCGDRCTTYCDLIVEVCSGRSAVADLDLESCLSLCSMVPDNPAFDPSVGDIKDHDDSIQCRMWHLAVATTAADPHCAHADGTSKCDGVFP